MVKGKLLCLAWMTALSICGAVALLWLPGVYTTRAMGTDTYTVYYVAPGGNCGSGVVPCYGTVQAAVDAADAPGEVIKIAAGVYTDIHARAGVTQVVYLSKTLVIQGGYTTSNWTTPDPKAHPTTLDAGGRGRVLYITGAISPTITGLRIVGGDAKGLGGHTAEGYMGGLEIFDAGGGVYAVTATVTLQDNSILGNRASVGGGLYAGSSAAIIRNNAFTSNIATYQGGGILLNECRATLEGNAVISNTGGYGGGAYLMTDHSVLSGNTFSLNVASDGGGGIYMHLSTTTVSGNQFSDNSARYGGGVHLAASDAVLRGNDLRSNYATWDGGGACLSGSDSVLRENTFVNNRAGRSGGGLSLFYSETELINNIVADNQATAGGSGLFVQASSARMQHTTVARNQGGDGSGIYVTEEADWFGFFASTVALTDTIIAGQNVGIFVTARNTATLEATLWGRGGLANQADWGGMGRIITGTHNYYGDPAFICANPSCPAPYRIHYYSPAIDAGIESNVNIDIDGEARPTGAGYDLGADEYHYTPVSENERLVLSFYYPWYESLSFWSAPFLADRPIFPYTSDDPAAISRHITWAREAGLDGFIASWWGWENTFIDGNFYRLLDSLDGTPLRATIYFETWSNPHFDSPAKIVAELKYVLDRYSNHPHFLKWEGRPVIFLYSVDSVAPNYPGTPYSKWQTVVNALRAEGYNPFLIADSTNTTYLNLFDGLHTYFALQSPAVYKDVSCQAHRAGKLWAANFYPGFDDSKLYWRDPYHLVIPRNNGRTYSETFAVALQSDPDWLVLTSFNEWFENTHIEPGVMYGYDYLLQTARLAAQFHAWRAFPTLYVNPAYSGPADGSSARPFRTLTEALIAAADGATLHLAGGVYTGTFTLTRSATLVGGYDPATWTRDADAHPTILRGSGSGLVVRVLPDPCYPLPRVVLDSIIVTGGNADAASPSGGGIYVQGATLVFSNSVASDNHARDHGGGVFITDGGQALLINSRVLSNTADVGGGMFVGNGAQAWLTNTLVARNTAGVLGGGLYARPEATLSVVNSTLADNSAPGSGNGLYTWPAQPQSSTIVNTILWGNGDDDLRCLGDCVVNYSIARGSQPGTGNMSVDPMFINPQQLDYHLPPRSPAVDTAHPRGVWPLGPAPSTDIDGDPRPMRSHVDIGMDEVRPIETALKADRNLARIGDLINYTVTLTNTGSQNLSFWVTDTLPLYAAYVPGSARASVGTITPPVSGTLVLPYLTWKGTVAARQTARLSFAVTVPPQTALYCAEIVNTVLIQSELAPRAKIVTWEHKHVAHTTSGEISSIAIRDAPGSAVTDRVLRVGESLTLYALAFDDCPSPNYLGPVSVNWSTSGTLEQRSGTGERFVFVPTRAEGQGQIVADDGRGHTARTGLITVVAQPPRIAVSPSSLSSVQVAGQRVTGVLTVTNSGGSILLYTLVPTYAFESDYLWKDSLLIDAETRSGQTLLDYYYAPEQVKALPAGCVAQVDEIELQSNGVNLANRVAWDWEVHLSNSDIPLPEGQLWDSQRDPSADSGAPVHFALVIGSREDPRSYAFRVQRNFRTGTLSVYPYYYIVKRSRSSPVPIVEGLHAQVAFWTGDPAVTIHFDTVSMTVRGEVDCARAGWLSATPVFGEVAPNGTVQIIVTFDSRGMPVGSHKSALIIRSSDPDNAVLVVPATLVVNLAKMYLPLVMREVTQPIR